MSILTTSTLAHKLKNNKFIVGFILFVSITALAVALFTQYVLGFPPCKLCMYQRVPFVALIIFSALGLLVQKCTSKTLLAVLITLVVAIGISGYHTGIERGIFVASERCNPEVDMPLNASVNDIKKMLYAKDVATCTKPPFTVLMLSMTEWNLLLNIFLLTLVAYNIFLNTERKRNAKT